MAVAILFSTWEVWSSSHLFCSSSFSPSSHCFWSSGWRKRLFTGRMRGVFYLGVQCWPQGRLVAKSGRLRADWAMRPYTSDEAAHVGFKGQAELLFRTLFMSCREDTGAAARNYFIHIKNFLSWRSLGWPYMLFSLLNLFSWWLGAKYCFSFWIFMKNMVHFQLILKTRPLDQCSCRCGNVGQYRRRNLSESLHGSQTEPGLACRPPECQGGALPGEELWGTKLKQQI